MAEGLGFREAEDQWCSVAHQMAITSVSFLLICRGKECGFLDYNDKWVFTKWATSKHSRRSEHDASVIENHCRHYFVVNCCVDEMQVTYHPVAGNDYHHALRSFELDLHCGQLYESALGNCFHDDGPEMHYMFDNSDALHGMVEDNMSWNVVIVAHEILESYGCVLRVISPRVIEAARGTGEARVEIWLSSFSSSTDGLDRPAQAAYGLGNGLGLHHQFQINLWWKKMNTADLLCEEGLPDEHEGFPGQKMIHNKCKQ
ncbi:hypothetical protein L1987_77296 [Smallanthus sonchifolius]|uniref:Uncharacterized protein n=1 Tax=Smallanthus sonchifolius TaxID=185202 RepID=A0ACB8Z9S4_9ASTR|nr:hypothetical protein L1987_77296 [Smallanthus sonchifolius]